MEATTYSNFRQHLRGFMRKVNEDYERLMVTTNDDTDIVIMSRVDYESWNEMNYLMKSEKNRKRLDDSIEQLEKGEGKVVEI